MSALFTSVLILITVIPSTAQRLKNNDPILSLSDDVLISREQEARIMAELAVLDSMRMQLANLGDQNHDFKKSLDSLQTELQYHLEQNMILQQQYLALMANLNENEETFRLKEKEYRQMQRNLRQMLRQKKIIRYRNRFILHKRDQQLIYVFVSLAIVGASAIIFTR